MTPYYVGLIVVAFWLFIKGYGRHKAEWTTQSWRRLALAFALSLVSAACGLFLAQRVDAGLQFGQTQTARGLSIIGMIALAMLTFSAPIHLLGWFATTESADLGRNDPSEADTRR